MTTPASNNPSAAAPEKFTLAPELVHARDRLGLTQAQLATLSGVSLAAIKGYETSRTLPGAKELRSLCQTLEITPNKLLFGNETPFTANTGSDVSVFPGLHGTVVYRNRIRHLLNLLTADECASFYSLMSALVLARHGSDELNAADQGADLFAGLEIMSAGGAFEENLFRLITRDKKVATQFAHALKSAADELQQPEKVSKK